MMDHYDLKEHIFSVEEKDKIETHLSSHIHKMVNFYFFKSIKSLIKWNSSFLKRNRSSKNT